MYVFEVRQAKNLSSSNDNRRCSRQDALYHFAVHVGESIVSALEAVGESLLIEAEEPENRGLEIMDVDLILCHRES